jgi:hypothetical protein
MALRFFSKGRNPKTETELNMKKTLVLLAGIILTAGLSARAQSTLADWTFETSLPSGTGQNSGSYNPESGIESATATATGSHASASTAYSSPSGNGSAQLGNR